MLSKLAVLSAYVETELQTRKPGDKKICALLFSNLQAPNAKSCTERVLSCYANTIISSNQVSEREIVREIVRDIKTRDRGILTLQTALKSGQGCFVIFKKLAQS